MVFCLFHRRQGTKLFCSSYYKKKLLRKMAKKNVNEAIAKYETFINEVLKEDLRKLESRLQEVNTEIENLIQQKLTLKVLTEKGDHPTRFKTQVNLGCNFFMEALVPDTSKLFMNIGLDHYLELTLAEAITYLTARIAAFEKLSADIRFKAAETKAHIKFMLCGLREMQKERKTS